MGPRHSLSISHNYLMRRSQSHPRRFEQRARWLLALVLSSCSVHEHDLTPYEKDAQGTTGGAAGSVGSGGAAGIAVGGAAGTMPGGAAGLGGSLDGSAETGDSGAPDSLDVRMDPSVDRSTDGPTPQDTSTDPIVDSISDGPSSGDGSTCLPDCPPTACGTISNRCGATLSCGPCQLSSTFANVSGVTLTTPRYGAAIVRIGNFAYVIGGYNNGTYLPSVERATIDTNGNLSNFSDAGVSLVLGRGGHTAFFINQQLYVIGGVSISYTASVERSTVDGNGNLGPFVTVSGVTLTTARGAHGSAVIGHNEYIIGGNGTSPLDNLESATFSTSGDLSTFNPVSGITLSTRRLGFGIAPVGGWLYVVGGATDVPTDAGSTLGYLTSIERAPFDPSGINGAFSGLPSVSLAVPRYRFAAFAFGANLYAIGGTNDVAGTLASVEQGTINPNGDVTGPFTVSNTIALSSPRAGPVFLLAPPWLYAIGGHSNSGELITVERAGVQ